MEKVLVTMRAYMDQYIQNAATEDTLGDLSLGVENSLETLLKRFSPEVKERQVQAYEEIVPGVCVGFSSEAGSFYCSAKTDTYHDDANIEDPAAGTSCLLIHPNLDPEHPLTYFTLETDVSIDGLREINNLTLDFVPAFNSRTDELVGSFSLFLRLYFPDSTHLDYHNQSYPVMGIPLGFSYHLQESQYEALPLGEAIGARIIINLPRSINDLNRILVSSFAIVGDKVE